MCLEQLLALSGYRPGHRHRSPALRCCAEVGGPVPHQYDCHKSPVTHAHPPMPLAMLPLGSPLLRITLELIQAVFILCQ